jgi:hypothetical protein
MTGELILRPLRPLDVRDQENKRELKPLIVGNPDQLHQLPGMRS